MEARQRETKTSSPWPIRSRASSTDLHSQFRHFTAFRFTPILNSQQLLTYSLERLVNSKCASHPETMKCVRKLRITPTDLLTWLARASVPACSGASMRRPGSKSPSRSSTSSPYAIGLPNRCSKDKLTRLKNSITPISWNATTSTALSIIATSSPNSATKAICRTCSRSGRSCLRMKLSPFSETLSAALESSPSQASSTGTLNPPTSSSKTR